jgi:hypothetical protein
VAAIGLASAVVFFANRDVLQVTLAPGLCFTAMALLVPAAAAVATPRQLGTGLLAGWIAGGLAIVLFYLVNLPRFDIERTGIVVFGGTLLALLVVAVPFSATGRARSR